MEETNQSSSDHRGLKLQNIIQKLSEHCDIKNPAELEPVVDGEQIDRPHDVPETKRRKQDTGETTVNGTNGNALQPSTAKNTEEQNIDLKPKCNITETHQQEDTSKASSTLPPERISARIRSLKSKKVMYKEDWVDPDHIRLSGQKIPVHSNKNTSHEDITKTVTRKRKRKRKKKFQSMEDYVNEAPLIQVGNLVGLRQCCLCAVMFVEREQLINHMKAAHHLDDKINAQKEPPESSQNDGKIDADEKPFKCSQCEASFRKSSGLKQHVTRQHSQNAPQKLTQAQANQASSKRSSPANDRPYACQVCGKAFKRKHHLQEHSYIHSDDKPYKCDICSKTFNQRICLTKHLPCREHEKQQRKPSCTKTLDTNTGNGSSQEQPHYQVNDQLCEGGFTESRSGSDLANSAVSQSSHNSCADPSKTPEVKCHVNGSECDGNTHISNGEPLRDTDSPASKDKPRPFEGHATNAVDSRGSMTDCSNVTLSGLLQPHTSAVHDVTAAVTTNDQTCSVKKPTQSSQEATMGVS